MKATLVNATRPDASLPPRPEETRTEAPIQAAKPIEKREREKEEAATEDQGRDAGGLPFSGPTYYPTSLLTKRPRPLTPVQLDTPELRNLIASGKVILTLWINDIGEVVEARVERSELPNAFAESAKSVFLHTRFRPGELNGQPVGSIMKIEVNYDDERLMGH